MLRTTARGSVLQEWVHRVPWKCQSILLSGLRGPDHANCPSLKSVTRWMRRVSQNNADVTTDYMKVTTAGLPTKESVESEVEYLPCHFVHHVADALRVIALWHPSFEVAVYARDLHTFIAEETFHFHPETDSQFMHRHRDHVGEQDESHA